MTDFDFSDLTNSDDTDEKNVPPSPIKDVTDRQAAQVHRGQARMAYRLAVLYRDKLLHVHGIGWHYWDSKRWAIDDRGKAKRAVLAVLQQAMSESFKLDEDWQETAS